MNEKEIVIYGASGYTGKLIAWKLAEAGIPFIAAGRNLDRLREQMNNLPELDNANYECVAVDNDEKQLTELFSGKKIVYNVVGPFTQLGEPVVRATLASGCHYLDTTGEADWMFHLKKNYGEKFSEKGLLLCPAGSWMWTAGLLAAELALEQPGIDSLDIVYLADSDTSVASTKSFLGMCTKPQFYLEHNQLQQWPMATSYPVAIPGMHRVYNSLPWSGGGETVWFEDDSRVTNCTTLVAFKSQEMFGAVLDILEEFEEKYRQLSADAQEEVTNQISGNLVTVEPEREDPDRNRAIVSCQGRGNQCSVSVVIDGNSPYIQTGLIAAEATKRILTGKLKETGFTSPCRAFGHRELIAALAEGGYLAWEARTT